MFGRFLLVLISERTNKNQKMRYPIRLLSLTLLAIMRQDGEKPKIQKRVGTTINRDSKMKKIILSLLGATAFFMLMSCSGGATQAGDTTDSLSVAEDSLALMEDSLDEALDQEMQPEKMMDAMVLHFVDSVEKRKSNYDLYNTEKVKYANKYTVTLRMNGDADIHIVAQNPQYNQYTGDLEFGEPENIDYLGIWVLRDKARGAGYIQYYDIEFNNGDRNLNWCVDIDCRYLYFNWNAFEKRYIKDARKIQKVDTLYVK